MKIRVNQKLLDERGREIILQDKSVMMLRDVIINAILMPDKDDDEKKKWEKYEIYKKLRDATSEEIDFSVEEVALIKKLIGKYQPQLIMGQCWEMLEGKL